MRYKTTLDTNTLFFLGLVLVFPTVLSIQAFGRESVLVGLIFAILAGLAFVAGLFDVFFSAYVFEDEFVFFKAAMGREKIKYAQIQEAHVREKDGKMFLYLSVGRRYPHKVRVKDAAAFLEELRARKPDLIEERED